MSITASPMNPNDLNATPIVRPLTPALQAIAISDLNEVPQRVADDILALRHWIHQQTHLRARTNDQLLLAFLRGAKFSLEKAKRKIDRYYALRSALPEIFNEQRRIDDSTLVLDIVRTGVILRLPLDEDDAGPSLTIIRAGSYDTDKFKFADIIRVGSIFGEIMCLEDDNAAVSGYVEIMDMSHITGTHFFQLRPELLRRFAMFADEAMPSRQRGTHFINVPAPFEKGFNSLRSFFPAKMLSRITVSSDANAIFEHVPKRYLPVEYGGENGTMQDITDRMVAKLMEYRDYFQDDCNYGSDEKLRDVQLFSDDNYFGVDGSFRRLEID